MSAASPLPSKWRDFLSPTPCAPGPWRPFLRPAVARWSARPAEKRIGRSSPRGIEICWNQVLSGFNSVAPVAMVFFNRSLKGCLLCGMCASTPALLHSWVSLLWNPCQVMFTFHSGGAAKEGPYCSAWWTNDRASWIRRAQLSIPLGCRFCLAGGSPLPELEAQGNASESVALSENRLPMATPKS